jgi:hypothetical protein
MLITSNLANMQNRVTVEDFHIMSPNKNKKGIIKELKILKSIGS